MRFSAAKSIFMVATALALVACGDQKPDENQSQGADQQAASDTDTPAASGQSAQGPEGTSEPEEVTAEQRAAYRTMNTDYAEDYRQGEDVTVLESGLAFKFLSRGPEGGKSPTGEDLIRIFYEGKTINGANFDSNLEADEPTTFPLQGLIKGWQQALPKMREGDVIELMVPSELGYGSSDSPDIPADSTLMFRIDLRQVLTTDEWLVEHKAAQQAYLAENAKVDGVVTTASGLQYKIIRAGAEDAEKPGPDAVVEAHYEGKLIDGTVFDSSYRRGQPSRFPLDRVIPGWTEGLQLMAPGAVYEFTIPYALAYGESGAGRSIPGFATLIFTVELVSFESRKDEWAERRALIGEDAAFVADYARQEGVQLSKSGVAYKIIKAGSGRLPTADDVVDVSLDGSLRDGSLFDETKTRGQTQTMQVSPNLRGFTEAIQLIPTGSSFEMVIPQGLAYGREEASEFIPPYSTLIFKGELLATRTQDEEADRLTTLQAEADAWFAAKQADTAYTLVEPGALVRTIKAGEGTAAEPLDRIKFTYAAILRDGTVVFDNRDQKPLPQAVGSYSKALASAFATMSAGGTYELILPYSLAYGASGRGDIPPFAPIIYEVQMQEILRAPKKANAPDDRGSESR